MINWCISFARIIVSIITQTLYVQFIPNDLIAAMYMV